MRAYPPPDDELRDVVGIFDVEFVVGRINYPPVILTNAANFLISWPCFEIHCFAEHRLAFEELRPHNLKLLFSFKSLRGLLKGYD